MDKLKMRMAALGGKAKEMPFSKESMMKLHAKKQGDGMDSMLASLTGEDKNASLPGAEMEDPAHEMQEVGELSPEETMLIMAFRKKKAAV